MNEPDFDLKRAHRWFAVEGNNLAWQLAELSARTAEETERMLEAAHVARHHWCAVGTPLNLLRAEILLATAHGLAHSTRASRHSARAVELADAETQLSVFDRGCLYGAASLAAGVAGDDAARREYAARFHETIAAAGADERPLLEHLYGAGTSIQNQPRRSPSR